MRRKRSRCCATVRASWRWREAAGARRGERPVQRGVVDRRRMLDREARAERGHGDELLAMVEALLAQSGIALGALDAIAFGRGPGAFTGLRLAASVTQGLAYSRGLPVIPVSDLRALAERVLNGAAPGARAIACHDARMGEVYWAAYHGVDGHAAAATIESVAKPDAMLAAAQDWLDAAPGAPTPAGVGTGFAVYPQLATLAAQLEPLLPDARPRAQRSPCWPRMMDCARRWPRKWRGRCTCATTWRLHRRCQAHDHALRRRHRLAPAVRAAHDSAARCGARAGGRQDRMPATTSAAAGRGRRLAVDACGRRGPGRTQARDRRSGQSCARIVDDTGASQHRALIDWRAVAFARWRDGDRTSHRSALDAGGCNAGRHAAALRAALWNRDAGAPIICRRSPSSILQHVCTSSAGRMPPRKPSAVRMPERRRYSCRLRRKAFRAMPTWSSPARRVQSRCIAPTRFVLRLIVAVGTYTPGAAEIDAATVRSCTLYVDDTANARHEAGDLLRAGVDWTQVRPIAAARARVVTRVPSANREAYSSRRSAARPGTWPQREWL